MFEFLSGLVDIMRDLLPDKSQPNRIWISRIVVLILALVGVFYLFFFTVKDTDLGKRMGFSSSKVIVTLPTLAEFAITHRRILNSLSEFKSNSNGQISNIFLVALYSKQSNDFVVTNPLTNRDFLIFAWSVPVQKFSNLNNTQLALNTNPSVVFNDRWRNEESQCYTQTVPKYFHDALSKIYQNENSTHYTLCKIFDRNRTATIAFTISFFKVQDLLEINILEYKQREVTIEVSQQFSRFTIPYSATN